MTAPPTGPSLTGLVLAGGRSSRMGQDKAVLRVGGRRLIDRAIATLAEICTEVIVAAGARTISDVGVRQVADSGADGPLAGIVAGLAVAKTDLVAVVAVDMPAMDSALLVDLARRWAGDVAVVPRVGGVAEPLHAVYAASWCDRLQAVLHAGERSPARVLADLGALVVDVEETGFARNLNRPSDL